MAGWEYHAVLAAFVLGLWLGRHMCGAKWRARGERGYPQIESAGHLYWVSREDRPCYRCAGQTRVSSRGE